MTIIQAMMLALMPSMALSAVLLCRPAFRRHGKAAQGVPVRLDISKGRTDESYFGFAAVGVASRSDTAKGGKGRSSIRRH
jgi:hypothetical protein